MPAIFIALGGNTGGPRAILGRFAAAQRSLAARLPVSGVRVSPVYRSKPAGPIPDQPDFLNAVATFVVPDAVSARELLQTLLTVEAELGRVRGSADQPAQGPRPIDMDLLFYGDAAIHDPGPPPLTVPHPRVAERAFVLQPLADLQGTDWLMPVIQRTVAECLADPEVTAQSAAMTVYAGSLPARP